MKIGRGLGLVVALMTSAASPALAQSTYVGAALVGDLFRSTHSESAGGRDFSNDGEAIGFALRVGTPIGSQWGVELEFTRPGEIETDFDGPIVLATEYTIVSSTLPTGSRIPQIFPPFSYRVRTTQRFTTLSTTAWVAQDVSERVSLVYLAGLGFSRTTYESDARFDVLPAGIAAPTILPSFSKTVNYGVRPLVGFEAHIGLTDQLDLVPGLRLHGLEQAWLLRPAVALGWNF